MNYNYCGQVKSKQFKTIQQGRGKCFFGDSLLIEAIWNDKIISGRCRIIDTRLDKSVILEGNMRKKGKFFDGMITVEDIFMDQEVSIMGFDLM